MANELQGEVAQLKQASTPSLRAPEEASLVQRCTVRTGTSATKLAIK